MTGEAKRVAFISGVARGQGRSHAIRLARLGYDIIGADLCAQMPNVHYPLATSEDLEATCDLVTRAGARFAGAQADVRDPAQLEAVVAQGVDEFGRLDAIIANAGIAPVAGPGGNANLALWRDVVDVNLTGVWNTIQAGLPTMIAGGAGGSIVITSSTAGLKGQVHGSAGATAYTATKHAVVGVMRALSLELAPLSIRVNTIHPTGVNTPLLNNDYIASGFLDVVTSDAQTSMSNPLPVEVLEPSDISDAVAWLVSDQARFVTGVTLPVDAGFNVT